MIRLLTCILISLMLGGCSLLFKKPETVTVIEYRDVPVNVPKKLLEPCEASAPLWPTYYMSLSAQEKETVLTEYSITLLSELKNCDNQVSGIRDYLQRRHQTP